MPGPMDVNEGPDGEVFLPAIYVTPGVEVDERTQLGRVTDFVGGDGEPVRGVGQRTFLIGEEAMPILEIQSPGVRAGAAARTSASTINVAVRTRRPCAPLRRAWTSPSRWVLPVGSTRTARVSPRESIAEIATA